MPTVNITVTYPAGQGQRILTAIAAEHGVPATVQGVTDALADALRSHVRSAVRKYETEAAVQAARANVTPVDIS